MKKDLDKLFSRTLFTYFSILFVIFTLKLFGCDYFEINTNNHIVKSINDFLLTCKLKQIWYTFTLFINTYIIFAISCNDNSKRMVKFSILTMPLNIMVRILKQTFNIPFLFVFTDLLYLFILSLCYIKFIKRDKIHRENITNYFVFTLITIIFQFISLITRGIYIGYHDDNLILSLIMNIDYFALLIISYKLYFIEGGNDLWIGVLGSSSDLLIFLKELPRKLQKSYQKYKPKETDDELTNKIYLTLF